MRRKTMKGGNLQEAQRRIDKWIEEGDIERRLDLSNLNLTTLPNIPDNVKILICNYNKLTSLPDLPNSLKVLYCYNNKLTSLPELPNSLKSLKCLFNSITVLPNLPNSLKDLLCGYNKLTTLPSIPNNLEVLRCESNKLNSLPELPDSLIDLNCRANKLITLPTLPEHLISLNCFENNLPEQYYQEENETMEEYIERIKNLQHGISSNINSSKIKEVNSNARNYIAFDNIKNGNVLVNLKRTANKYNSNYKEYITKNTYNTMLQKTLKHPITRYTMKRKNIKYYTAKKKNNSK